MRKYLVAALAATATIGVGTAWADGPHTASMNVNVAPKKAGTKKHPVNSSIKLKITNDNPQAVASKLVIHLPKTLKTSGKGWKTCKKSKLDNTTLDSKGRPKDCTGNRVGSGTASAQAGVNTLAPFPVTFVVTPIVGDKDTIYFYLHAKNTPIAVNVVAPGQLTKKNSVLTVSIPKEAQSIPPLWNGLVSLQTTLKGKKGKHLLIGSVGCKNHKQPFSTDVVFGRTYSPVPDPANPQMPIQNQGPGYKTTVKDAAPCK